MHLLFWLYIVALLSAAAAVAITCFVQAQHHTPVARLFALCTAALLLITLSLVLQHYALLHLGELRYRFSVFALVVMVAGSAGLVGTAPFLYHELFGRSVGLPLRLAYICLATVFLGLAVSLFFRSGSLSILIALNLMLFGTVGFGIVYMIVRYRLIGDRRLRRAVRVVVAVFALFTPLIVLDAMLMRLPLPPVVAAFEGTILPTFLLIANVLAIRFASTYLNEPPYVVGGRISCSFRSTYDVSLREADIIGMIVEGKTPRQVADALMISAGTVEDHLYAVCRKTSVKNPTQLVNLIREHRGCDISPSRGTPPARDPSRARA